MILVMTGLVVAGLAALLLYVVREAAVLKATAAGLQAQLAQFKEGGFDRLVAEKLTALTQRATDELAARERFIQQSRRELLDFEQRAVTTVERLKTDLGMLTEKVAGLGELQAKVQELNDLLKPQQLRGELGEVIVRSLIADKLPPEHYEEEHVFSDGKRVEFVLKLSGRLIPVDSKLQLEGFRRLREADERQRPALRTEFKRTIRQKIDEVKQYIRPEEGTFDFAFMVIPSEAVYYELIAQREFTDEGGPLEYATQQHVVLVSPMTFWAYLTSVAYGLRGLEIERRAGEILAHLQTLASSVRQFAQEEFRKVGGHLRNAASQYDEAERKLRGIEGDLTSLERAERPQLTGAAPHGD